MEIKIHQTRNYPVAELQGTGVLISNTEDALDLLGNLYYQDVERVILHEDNITPAFFDLSTGIAGEILQKYTNYKMRLAIVGDFSKYPGQAFRDFIFESNKGKQVNFLDTTATALVRLSS
ncbi:DUF4180 domain-containing protein [Chitinophaga sp. Cy-1792]|uniref:DUF4180 domain-containing protein n=1 Tax=Chitinophaga sp. Cy-1792 TaxID=2608339 RepID=UPI0014223549|nr:DUF4180 domain-containing protein [Chitinophaga sp. Cy-1792]NIG55438.1 DUF4180 domain-containing protein [Chitinophaga sp. Cy-1792]